jgi:hypothetical protein
MGLMSIPLTNNNKANNMNEEMICPSCKVEADQLFDVEGVGYCSDCQCEAEVAIIEADEMDSLADDY